MENKEKYGCGTKTVLILHVTQQMPFQQIKEIVNPPDAPVLFSLCMRIPSGNIVQWNKWGSNHNEKERLQVKVQENGDYYITDSIENNHEFPIRSVSSISTTLYVYYAETIVRQPTSATHCLVTCAWGEAERQKIREVIHNLRVPGLQKYEPISIYTTNLKSFNLTLNEDSSPLLLPHLTWFYTTLPTPVTRVADTELNYEEGMSKSHESDEGETGPYDRFISRIRKGSTADEICHGEFYDQLAKLVEDMRGSEVPAFLCPKELPEILLRLGVPKGECVISAVNFTTCVIQQITLCCDVYTHAINTTLKRTRYVSSTKEGEQERTQQVKTCDACCKQTHYAITVPLLQYQPGGQTLILRIIKQIISGIHKHLQNIDNTFDNVQSYQTVKRELMEVICSRSSLLCCRCFFPVYHYLQFLHKPREEPVIVDEKDTAFASLQEYIRQLSISRFITDNPVSLLMHVHHYMQHRFQFQIVDRNIPLQVNHTVISTMDIQLQIPILSKWKPLSPTAAQVNQPIQVIVTTSGYVYYIPYDSKRKQKEQITTQQSIDESETENALDENEEQNKTDHMQQLLLLENNSKWIQALETIQKAVKKVKDAKKKTEWYIGKNVRKTFENGDFEGIVTRYVYPYYGITYEDADYDDMTEGELQYHIAQYMQQYSLVHLPQSKKLSSQQQANKPKGTRKTTDATVYTRLTIEEFLQTYTPLEDIMPVFRPTVPTENGDLHHIHINRISLLPHMPPDLMKCSKNTKLLNILLQSLHVVGKICARYLSPANPAYTNMPSHAPKRTRFLSRKLLDSEECNKIQASASVDYRLPENLMTWYLQITAGNAIYITRIP